MVNSELDIIRRIIYAPMPWHLAGLTYTASGYGAKIPSRWMAVCRDGRKRRIYVVCYSNAASMFIVLGGKKTIIPETVLQQHQFPL